MMRLPNLGTKRTETLAVRPALPHRCGAQQRLQLHHEAVWAAQTVPGCSYTGSCGMRRTGGRSLVQPSWAWRHRLAGLRQSHPPGLCRAAASDDSRRSADKKGANVRDSGGKEEAFCPPGEPAQGGCCGFFHKAVRRRCKCMRHHSQHGQPQPSGPSAMLSCCRCIRRFQGQAWERRRHRGCQSAAALCWHAVSL